MSNIINPKDFKPIKAKRLIKNKISNKQQSKISNPESKKNLLTILKNFLFGWLLTTKSSQENIFQYLFRQILLVDSKGVPSITTTITFLTVVLTYFWFKYETQIALSFVTTTTENGSTTTIKGYNDYTYIILILIISAVLTMYYKRDHKKYNENESQTNTIISAIKDFIMSKIK